MMCGSALSCSLWSPVVFFFFQAEDGIRDADVTGVQTCALPICWKLLALIQGYAPEQPAVPVRRIGPKYLERLVIKSGGRVTLLRVAEIEWIDAEGDYVRIHVGKQWHLLPQTMKPLPAQLNPPPFLP